MLQNPEVNDIKTKKVSVVQIDVKEPEIHHINSDEKSSGVDTGPRFGSRHVQMILLCLAQVVAIGTRTNLSVAIVAMTDNSTSSNPNIPTYDWNDTSVILSAFFWSYITLQVVAGYVGKLYGPKYFLLVALSINFTICALTPLAADKLGSIGVIICRILQGMSQGFLYPSCHVFLGRWTPEPERTTLSNIAFTGAPIGQILSTLITGYVSASSWGWPVSFYILSAMGYCWCIIWFFFGQNSPATDPRITPEEKQYIQASLNQEDEQDLPTPWKKIFTSFPFIILILAFVGNNWGYSVLLTETPTYLAKAMNFDMQSNAIVSSIPTAMLLIGNLAVGPIGDWVVNKELLSVIKTRKLFSMICGFGQALCLIWISFLKPSQSTLSVFNLAMCNFFNAFGFVGWNINHIDLSPRFSGVLFAIANATGIAVSIVGPLTANWIVTDMSSISQWQIVFIIAAGFYIFGALIFFFFASAKRQSWDGPENKELERRRKKISIVSFIST